jgi:hypothetical protein
MLKITNKNLEYHLKLFIFEKNTSMFIKKTIMENFVTVAVFNLPSDIAVLKSVLENHNIIHFFENETIVSIDPFASFAYGGIKLKVHKKDITLVKEILDSFDNNKSLRIV